MNLLHFFFPVFKASSRWVHFFYEISFDLTHLCKHRSDWRWPQSFEGGLNMWQVFLHETSKWFHFICNKNKLKKLKVHTRTNLSSTNNHKVPQIFVIYTNEAASPSSWASGVLDSYKYSILVKAWCEGFHLWIKAASVTNSDQHRAADGVFHIHRPHVSSDKSPAGREGERWEDFLCLASLSPSFPFNPACYSCPGCC